MSDRRFRTSGLVSASIMAVLGAIGAAGQAGAAGASSVASFYKGKTVTVVIGSSAGGGYDLYGRLVARYLGRYLPGRPDVIATNMSGAASAAAAQYVYNTAPKDGTVLAEIYPGGVMEPLLGTKGHVRYDSTKFNYVGSANADAYLCEVREDAPVKTLQDAMKQSIILGASASGGSTHDFPTLLNHVLGTKFKIVSGYPGSNEITLAIEKGEVQGACGIGWSSLEGAHPDWLKNKFVRILVQEGIRSNADLKRLGVPLAIDFAKTDQQRQIMRLIYSQPLFGRPFIMAPEVPKERVEAMRQAFKQALSSAAAKAQAKKEKLDLDPMWGAELQKTVADLYATPPTVVEEAKKAISD